MSAAWSQCSSPLIALNITSRCRHCPLAGRVRIPPMDPPRGPPYPRGRRRDKRTDHLISGAARSCTPCTDPDRPLDTSSAAAVIGTVSEAGPALRGGRTRQAEAGWRGGPTVLARPRRSRSCRPPSPATSTDQQRVLQEKAAAPIDCFDICTLHDVGEDAAWPALVLDGRPRRRDNRVVDRAVTED